jgi:tetratricopeptide (TPR) repeat protein
MNRSPDEPMNRLLMTVTLVLAGALPLEAQSPLDMEQASEAARRAAMSAIRGPSGPFLEALDANGLLEQRVGTAAWRGLKATDRERLRAAVRERFHGMLAPPRPVAGEVAWSAALPAPSGGVSVLLGLRLEGKTLKTRWVMRRSGSVWRVRDVVLSDPGISLAGATAATLGPQPVAARRPATARREILPMLSALLVILLVVALAAPRLPAPRRKYLYLAASVPALVFLVAGSLALARVVGTPYVLGMIPAGQPWQKSEDLALKAEHDGRREEARLFWDRALAAGEPAGPVAYERGVAAKRRGESEAARAFFDQAFAAPVPAPGAARELAALALEERRLPEAERQIAAYLAAAGPDPEALSLEAVIKTEMGKTAEALSAIAEARRLVGGATRGAELEAQIRARAGDAGGAVAALRPLTQEGRLDRSVLRADPAYLPIATDPAWVSFLNEK